VLGIIAQEPDDINGTRSIIISCDSNDTFGTMWRKVFQEVLLRERQLGFDTHLQRSIVGRWNPDTSIESPNDVRLLIGGLLNHTVVIIDEFDRVPVNSNARQLLADTIKLFSDTNTHSSIVVVGVGQSIEELIAAHQSISRNMDYVAVEPMTPEELAQIIQRGYATANMQYEPGLDFKIAQLSQGYPHYTHLLGLWAGRKAAERRDTQVTSGHLHEAIPFSIQNAAGGIRFEYDQATDSTQPNNLFRQVLLACALADKDIRGRFPLGSLREPLRNILKRRILPVSYQRHLAAFCAPERGPVLVKTGRRKNYRWHFANPQLIPFVHLQGIRDGLVPNGFN
jgi:hypothetical protein